MRRRGHDFSGLSASAVDVPKTDEYRMQAAAGDPISGNDSADLSEFDRSLLSPIPKEPPYPV
jgi:hypothetical protein